MKSTGTHPTFNISDHLDKLDPVQGEKNCYFCPVCRNNNLKVDPKTGKYQCWSGCQCRDIRNAVAPLPAKQPNPKQERVYPYADRQGKEVIQVVRRDNGNGSKQIFQQYYWRGTWRSSGVPEDAKQQLKASVLPYRYQEAMQHDRIFWVEGEKCTDALWNMGIPAVTTIGGSEGLERYGDYAGLFEHKDLVLCPDMDASGLKYCEGVAALYPNSPWLYAFPADPRWQKLPGKGGLDVADWIAQGATASEIVAAIETQKRVMTEVKVTPIRPGVETALNLEQTTARIRELLLQDLSPAALQAAKIELRSQTIIQEREFSDLWKTLEAERELTESRSERKDELDNLLAIERYDLSLRGILHDAIAMPLETISTWLGATPAAMLLTLLPTVATLCRAGTELELIKATGFTALPILYTGICAESGSAKSPMQKTILKPLFKLQAEAEQQYQEELQHWELDCKTAKGNEEPPPPKPTIREYYTVDVTREAVAMIQAQQPEHGFLGWMDELSAIIGGQNQYRNGRGTDREALLSGRDGTGLKVNRAGGKRISVPLSLYSITGGTQPDTLRKLMGDFSDSSGQWARFLWCLMPVKSAPYPDAADSSTFDSLQAVLYSVYRAIEDFPAQTYRLDAKAQAIYRQWFNELDEKRIRESRQALRSCYAKAKSNTGEIALLLHLFNAAVLGQQPDEQLSAATIQAAIKVMKFCLGQVKLIHAMGDESRGELSPILAKIMELCRRKGGISARDAKNSIFALRMNKTMTTAAVRQLFSELVAMGHGVIEGIGDRAKFKTVDPTVDPGSTGSNAIPAMVSENNTATPVDLCRSQDLQAQSFDTQELQTKCRSLSEHTPLSASTPAAPPPSSLTRSTDLQCEFEASEMLITGVIKAVDPQIYSNPAAQSQAIAEPPTPAVIEGGDVGSTDGSTGSTVAATDLRVGDRVNKRLKLGWVGSLVSLHADGLSCDVLWHGDKHPTSERLSSLKRAP